MIASPKNVLRMNPSLPALPKRPIDRYHVPDILDLKRGWTGINNAHVIFRMHNLFWVNCLCPSTLVSNQLAHKDTYWRVWIQKCQNELWMSAATGQMLARRKIKRRHISKKNESIRGNFLLFMSPNRLLTIHQKSFLWPSIWRFQFIFKFDVIICLTCY